MIARLMGLATVAPAELDQMIREEHVVVIDVNAPASWSEAHVPGAVNLDPESYTGDQLPSDKETTLVFYCSGSMCRKAPNAARRAVKMGHHNVKVMSAGIRGWRASKLPLDHAG